MDVLNELYMALNGFVLKLKKFFDQTRHRLCFFNIKASGMQSEIYFGAIDLYADSQIANRILR